MPKIFGNIETYLLPALEQTLQLSERSDFCVGYFNLRGWKALDSSNEAWPGGPGHQCRLIVGMQRLPQEELCDFFSLVKQRGNLDNQTAIRLKKRMAEEFRSLLAFGVPANQDEAGLRCLANQLRARKTAGGQLGRPFGARFRTCERLKRYADFAKGTLFAPPNGPSLSRTSTAFRCGSQPLAPSIGNSGPGFRTRIWPDWPLLCGTMPASASFTSRSKPSSRRSPAQWGRLRRKEAERSCI